MKSYHNKLKEEDIPFLIMAGVLVTIVGIAVQVMLNY